MLNTLRPLAGIALCALSLPTLAGVVQIDLFDNGPSRAQGAATFSSMGQSVTVTGQESGGSARDVWLFQGLGVGVTGGVSNQVDALESLVLDFSPEPVDLLRSLVLDVSPGDFGEFSLFADDVFVGSFDIVTGPGSITAEIDLGGVSGDVFRIQSTGFDRFALRTVEVQTNMVAAPGTLALLGLGGLAAAAASRRRRRA